MRCPSGFGGLPAPLPSPWLNGRKPRRSPGQPGRHRTPARCPPRSAPPPAAAAVPSESRSVRYCAIACSTVWPVSGFFNSAVATGIPFTNSPRSSVFVDARLVRQLAGHRQPVRLRTAPPAPGSDPDAGRKNASRISPSHARIHHPVAQHIDRAPRRRAPSPADPANARCAASGDAVRLADLLPLLALRRPDEREQLRRVEPRHRIEVRAARHRALPTLHRPDSRPRRSASRRCAYSNAASIDPTHAATPGTSNSPVTAAVINACRCSTSRSI